MQKVSLLAAAAFASLVGVGSANAMTIPAGVPTDGHITLVAGGCGYYGHRAPNGYCVPDGRPVYRVCPRGFHLAPYRRACWPNR
jgi:hypothetical protein